MTIVQVINDQIKEVPIGSSIQFGGVQHPWQVTELWSDAELAAIDVYRAADAIAPPDKIVTGSRFDWDGDRVVQVLDLADRPPEPQPIVTLSRRQFYQALALAGYITETEALAAMAGVIPAPLSTAIDALADAQEQFTARMLLAGGAEFRRDHPLVEIIGAAHGQSAAQIDQFFATAAML